MRKRIGVIVLQISILAFVVLGGVALLRVDSNAKINGENRGYQDDEIVEAIVFIEDLSHEAVLETFAERYPEESAVYTFVKESVNPLTDEDFDTELLDAAIVHKRLVYEEAYNDWNSTFSQSYDDSLEVVFQSAYSPMIIVRIPYRLFCTMQEDSRVVSIDLCEDATFSNENLTLANTFTRADYVRDTFGNDGSGIKIGMIEVGGIPNVSSPYLTNASIIIRPADVNANIHPHATNVARVLVGTSPYDADDGFAPGATLYCAGFDSPDEFYSGVEWFVHEGVNVINASVDMGEEGVYGNINKWIDHLAVQHDVHFVTSAGNKEDYLETYMVTAPGMAYNAMTVGGFNPGTATQWNQVDLFTMWSSSRYDETGSEYSEKPNLVADYYGWDNFSGTSFAAPQVAGVIAQLCSYQSALKTKQTSVGAILMASAARKVDATDNGRVGSLYYSTVQVPGSYQISDKSGAGILDARWARGVVAAGNYWNPVVYDNGFPYTKTINLTADTGKTVRVCIFWLRQNSISGTNHATNSPTVGTMSNLDLKVLSPSNTIMAQSTTVHGNFEIVQFTPTYTGTYTIKIEDMGGHQGKDYIGIAVWQGNSGQ